MKAIYFDMDGTIADLYGYENWLEMLHAEDTTPYEKCGVLVDIEELQQVLNEFIKMGIIIGIISWGAMNGSHDVVKYGTPKHYVRKEKDSILVDDNEEVRNAWKGETIDATKNIVELLRELL